LGILQKLFIFVLNVEIDSETVKRRNRKLVEKRKRIALIMELWIWIMINAIFLWAHTSASARV